jgi:SprT-like family
MRRRRSQRQAEAADAALLTIRLERLGLHGVAGIEVHANRTVLVTVTKRRMLRVHRGFAYASDRVLNAIVRFVSALSSSRRRRTAQRTIVDFPVEAFVGSQRRRRPERGDRRFVSQLRQMHAQLNAEHFGAELAAIAIRVSTRMRTRLGELSVHAVTNTPLEIAVGLVHIQRDGWEEVRHTLLHEMVHQWQVESGLKLDHGPMFRKKACEVGIEPRAMRDIRPAQPTMLEC